METKDAKSIKNFASIGKRLYDSSQKVKNYLKRIY